jgi:hypothetical protein
MYGVNVLSRTKLWVLTEEKEGESTTKGATTTAKAAAARKRAGRQTDRLIHLRLLLLPEDDTSQTLAPS